MDYRTSTVCDLEDHRADDHGGYLAYVMSMAGYNHGAVPRDHLLNGTGDHEANSDNSSDCDCEECTSQSDASTVATSTSTGLNSRNILGG